MTTNEKTEMGVFNWSFQVVSADGSMSRTVTAMVDTGASYTVLPSSLLRELGIEVVDTSQFELGDGSIATWDLGEARVTLDGRTLGTQVIFGDDDARLLLGAYTLEGFRLAVDPSAKRLVRLIPPM
jgi:clan AA aspartic protease